MQNIWFNTSQYSTTIALENIGATIEHMAHDFPTIFSCVPNGLFIYIVKTNFLLS